MMPSDTGRRLSGVAGRGDRRDDSGRGCLCRGSHLAATLAGTGPLRTGPDP